MKYFYIQVVTQYDGLEWIGRAVTGCTTFKVAQDKANKCDFTHDNGIEVQGLAEVEEITEAEYKVLAERLTVI